MSESIEQYLDPILPEYQASYFHVHGKKLDRFFCPILMTDGRDERICRGHITPGGTGGKLKVPQLERVDNFFGSAVQHHADSWAKAQEMNELEILSDESIHRSLGTVLLLDDNEVEVFPTKKQARSLPETMTAAFVSLDGKPDKWFGIRVSTADAERTISNTTKLTVSNRHDPSSSVFATLIHAAHLTMFYLLKYEYAFSSSGYSVGTTLRTFYERCHPNTGNSALHSGQISVFVHDVFQPFRNICRQMNAVPERLSRSSCESRWFINLIDLNNQPWALGVAVKFDSTVNLVLLPENSVEGAVTYEQFRENPFRNVRYNFVRLKEDASIWELDHEVHIAPWPKEHS